MKKKLIDVFLQCHLLLTPIHRIACRWSSLFVFVIICLVFAWLFDTQLICRLRIVISLHQFHCFRLNCFLSSSHFHIQSIANIRFEFITCWIFDNFPNRFANRGKVFHLIFTMCSFIVRQLLSLTIIWSHDWLHLFTFCSLTNGWNDTN